MSQLFTTNDNRGTLGTEAWASYSLDAIWRQLASRSTPYLGFPWLTILTASQEKAVHLLSLLSSVPISVYSGKMILFDFGGYLPQYGIPPGLELSMKAFSVWCTISVISQAYTQSTWGESSSSTGWIYNTSSMKILQRGIKTSPSKDSYTPQPDGVMALLSQLETNIAAKIHSHPLHDPPSSSL